MRYLAPQFWRLYHMTKQSLSCLNWLLTCFQFYNLFWKNISCFWFWWKSCTKYYTNNYVVSFIKRLSLPALAVGQVLSISGYDLEDRRILCKQKFWIKIKYMVVKILILILFSFCLLWWLSPVSVVAGSWFNYKGPFRCFWLVLDGFSSF